MGISDKSASLNADHDDSAGPNKIQTNRILLPI